MNSHTQPFLRQTRSPSSPRRPRAQVFSYPWQRPGCLGGRTRAPHHRRLVFGGASATEDKARWAGVWRDLWGRAWLRDILVIINPVGGVRGAARVYEKVCAAAAGARTSQRRTVLSDEALISMLGSSRKNLPSLTKSVWPPSCNVPQNCVELSSDSLKNSSKIWVIPA